MGPLFDAEQSSRRVWDRRELLDLLVDVETDRRVDTLLVASAAALVGREQAVVIEIGERLRGELAAGRSR